jgi:hypothetical protein
MLISTTQRHGTGAPPYEAGKLFCLKGGLCASIGVEVTAELECDAGATGNSKFHQDYDAGFFGRILTSIKNEEE